MEITIDKNVLIIKAPISTPVPSKSGKTLVVATSAGNVRTAATFNGKPVTVGFNAYIAKD